MRRTLYDDVHNDFRESFERFVEKEIEPNVEQWERDGIVPREYYERSGELGFLAMAVPEQYGGAEADDFRFNAVIAEVSNERGIAGYGLGIGLHNDICLPYFLEYCNEEQRDRWLPGIVSGELITAVAMTEPGIGSDLAGMTTRAERVDGGYKVNGAKTFITNGINSDLIITAVKTDAKAKHRGISLVIIERGMDGFARGRNLEKVGQHSQDTAELFFEDVFVPEENLLGNEGEGFRYLASNLAQERLSIAVAGVAAARGALKRTIEYVMEREAFGQSIGTFQNSRFTLADCHTEIEVAQAFVDRCIEALNAGELSADEAAMAKLHCTELQSRVADRCLQLHGGYGYVLEYPIARAWADARVTRIYGGANEIMKEIIGRSLGLDDRRR